MKSSPGGAVASNYIAICEENRESYGTKGAQKSGKLAADLYDDRTHFIFELLQNAEDALGRRVGWLGERKVHFALNQTQLKFSHFGKPFARRSGQGSSSSGTSCDGALGSGGVYGGSGGFGSSGYKGSEKGGRHGKRTPGNVGDDHLFPISEHIPTMTTSIPMTSIMQKGCKLRHVQST
ncbi:hypothetical protein LZV53_14350 [Klebsiella michiganensis]|uniref:hypothetical protein n=1 Tax=Klebsiella michiganensis TaxID=1134687 RepID=UPI001F470A82|nr:hypothetical protein [Klebsiella michiganensis]MCE7545736.1 hypothetical protein [Klebsiella michiganensis]